MQLDAIGPQKEENLKTNIGAAISCRDENAHFTVQKGLHTLNSTLKMSGRKTYWFLPCRCMNKVYLW